MMTGEDILCISSIDWDFLWQGHQEIMSTLARQGNRVLFVENTGVRRAMLRDLPRLRHRLRNWWRGTKGFREEGPSLFVYSPVVVPLPYSRIARWINRTILLRALGRWMDAAGFDRPIVWTFLPTPLVRDVIRGVDPVFTVYYCIDDLASSSPAARHIRSSEDALFRDADLVFVTSEKLWARAARATDRVHLFPFGVDYGAFERVRDGVDAVPEDLKELRRPVAGYVGGLHHAIDQDLLAAVADRLPEVSFALVGPVQTDVTRLTERPNIHLLGTRTHADLPRYIKGFDVGLIPYSHSEYTAHVYPTKLNEYLAMGIPVVATALPELQRFNAEHGGVIALTQDAAAFAEAIVQAADQTESAAAQRRIDVARKNGWEARIGEMTRLIEGELRVRRATQRSWEKRLRQLYRVARRRLIAPTIAVVMAYVLFFHAPLLWWVAAPLYVSEPPAPADAIVVFAGGLGESGKAGGGYQERVAQAAELYFAGKAPRIIFSSGYVFAFREAEVMREVAVAHGVPRTAIVLEGRAGNTHLSVVLVNEILKRERWRSILLVSSPYHMRRALLTWRRVAPDVNVIASPVSSSQFYTHGAGANLEQAWAIAQEYVAIVVYWWRGWI